MRSPPDGQSVGGCTHAATNGMHCDWPFLWRSGSGSTLLHGLSGAVEYGSVEAISADGTLAAGAAGWRAVLWRPLEGTVQEIGLRRSGLGAGEVRDLSPDGSIAVGQQRHRSAFRWTAASGMVLLGPETRIAHAVSADGARIVGEGEFDGVPQAFIWDALHGARPLADVLRDQYGFDLGEFHLSAATAMSPDGKTIVGNGGDPNGLRGWRARLREEPCLPELRIDSVLVEPDLDPPLGRIEAIASDAPERVYVSAGNGYFVRVDVDEDGSAGPPVPLPDLFDGSNPMFVGPGTDGVYAGGGGHPHLVRVAADGTASTVFDGATWPPLAPPSDQMPTFPLDVAIAPDGTLFVAAYARLVRIEPDGSAHELIDAPHAAEAMGLGQAGIWHVAGGANGRLFVLFEHEGVLVVDAVTGAVVSARRDLDGAQGLAADPDGGFWLYGDRLAHYTAAGARNRFFDSGEIPDGAGGTAWSADSLVVDERGDAYYFGYDIVDNHPFIARIDAEGVAEQIIGWGRPPGFYSFFRVDALHTSHRMLYFASGPSVLRIGLPPASLCANGLDDDGDGAADYPSDKGCLSAQDDGERSFDFPCDNGIDDDHDGVADFPADPGCASLTASREATECDDDLDNDGDGSVDWDGAATEVAAQRPPTPSAGATRSP